MTKLIALTVLAALAAAPCLAQEDGRGQNRGEQATFSAPDEEQTIQREPRRTATRRFTVLDGPGGDPLAMTSAEASDWADMLCNGDSMIWYDEDENGEPVEGTIDFECLNNT